jgi:hypothetical protein
MAHGLNNFRYLPLTPLNLFFISFYLLSAPREDLYELVAIWVWPVGEPSRRPEIGKTVRSSFIPHLCPCMLSYMAISFSKMKQVL